MPARTCLSAVDWKINSGHGDMEIFGINAGSMPRVGSHVNYTAYTTSRSFQIARSRYNTRIITGQLIVSRCPLIVSKINARSVPRERYR